jgi:hypothetical protein
VLPNTGIYDIGERDDSIEEQIIRSLFWIIGLASIVIWFIMCIKDLIDERKEESLRQEIKRLQEETAAENEPNF